MKNKAQAELAPTVVSPHSRGTRVARAFCALATTVAPTLATGEPGGGASAKQPDAIRPFRVDIPEAALVDLRRRVVATQWPEQETVADESQGVQLAVIQKLARYWATEYDWRKCEAKLNALPQFITEIDGLDIHFIHVRSKHENALPMIVTHGCWRDRDQHLLSMPSDRHGSRLGLHPLRTLNRAQIAESGQRVARAISSRRFGA